MLRYINVLDGNAAEFLCTFALCGQSLDFSRASRFDPAVYLDTADLAMQSDTGMQPPIPLSG